MKIDITKKPYLADNTGKKSCKRIVNRAIKESKPGDTLYFPQGTYKGIFFNPVKPGLTVKGS